MIRFETRARLERPAGDVFEAVFDAGNWTSFEGHGLIPAIEAVTITPGPNGRLGTRFQVHNADGSKHTETVINYVEGTSLTLRMDDFSKPLSRFADHFMETWRTDGETLLRSFELVARNPLGSILLRLVRPSLRRAVEKQTQEMALAI